MLPAVVLGSLSMHGPAHGTVHIQHYWGGTLSASAHASSCSTSPLSIPSTKSILRRWSNVRAWFPRHSYWTRGLPMTELATIVTRGVLNCRWHGRPLSQISRSVGGFEIGHVRLLSTNPIP